MLESRFPVSNSTLFVDGNDKRADFIGRSYRWMKTAKATQRRTFDGPENWMDLLTLQEQFDMLTQAGYDVELAQYRCVEETEWLMEYGNIIDPRSIDMTLSYVHGDEGWDCGWRRRNAASPAQSPAQGKCPSEPVCDNSVTRRLSGH
jgi:hypothetical protein